MKEVNFLKLSGKNFLSIGNIPIKFNFPSGINIITGYNFDKNDENGVGKTTIVQLFYWTLFGSCISNLKKDQIVNDINQKDCVGILEFNVVKNGKSTNYRIERGIKPSFCKIFENNQEDKNLPSIPATNKRIEDIISSTPLIFKNCIVLSMNNSIPFMAQSKPERKNFIESMFRLEVLRHMDKEARKNFNELTRKQDINLENFKNLKENEKNYSINKENFENQKTEKINKLNQRRKSYIDEINISQSKIIKVDISKLNLLKQKIIEIEKAYKQNEEKKQELNSLLFLMKNKIDELTQQKLLFSEEVIKKSSNFDIVISKENALKSKLDSLPNVIKDLESINNELKLTIKNDTSKLEKIKKLGEHCITCERPFSKLDKEKNDSLILDIETEISTSQNKIFENENKINDLENNKKIIIQKLQLITDIKKYKEINDNISQINFEIEKNKSLLEPILTNHQKFDEQKADFTDQISKIEFQINKNDVLETQIKNLNKFIESIDHDISHETDQENTFENLFNENKQRLDKSQKEIDTIKTDIEIYDSIKFIVSEEGIKSYIIKKLLNILNERIRYYLNVFESNSKLTFDEYFDDNLFNDKNIEKCYDNFSGGERKRIDLACLFSFLDIRRIQGDVRFNVIFFDELLDSAISSKACNLIFNVLKERKNLYNENSYIITHRKELKTDSKILINNTIFLEKRNGFTKIGEKNDVKI